MPKLTPAEIAEKQVRKAQTSTEDYTRGVRNVREAPTQQAAKKKGKLKANWLKAIDSGKWEDGLNSVSLEQWKMAAEGKGARNYAQGVADAADKVRSFWEDFGPYLDGVKQKIATLPDETEAQRDQRLLENVRMLRQYKRKRIRR